MGTRKREHYNLEGYIDEVGKFRWTQRDLRNGEIVGAAHQGFTKSDDMLHNLEICSGWRDLDVLNGAAMPSREAPLKVGDRVCLVAAYDPTGAVLGKLARVSTRTVGTVENGQAQFEFDLEQLMRVALKVNDEVRPFADSDDTDLAGKIVSFDGDVIYVQSNVTGVIHSWGAEQLVRVPSKENG